jgi:hypothetical protein
MADSIWAPGGYQAFRAGRGSAQVSRGPAAASAGPLGPWQAHLELVPLLGSIPDLWDVCGYYQRGNTTCAYSRIVRGGETAQQHYRRLVDAFRDPGPELAQLIGAEEAL